MHTEVLFAFIICHYYYHYHHYAVDSGLLKRCSGLSHVKPCRQCLVVHVEAMPSQERSRHIKFLTVWRVVLKDYAEILGSTKTWYAAGGQLQSGTSGAVQGPGRAPQNGQPQEAHISPGHHHQHWCALNTQCTLHCPSGRAVVAGSLVEQAKHTCKALVPVVGIRIVASVDL